MKNKLFVFFYVYLILYSSMFFTFVNAEEISKKPKWKDKGEISCIDTHGNTDITSFSFNNELTLSYADKASFLLLTDMLYGKENNNKTAERYSGELSNSYVFFENYSGKIYMGYSEDIFSGIEKKYYLGFSLGRRLKINPSIVDFHTGADIVKEEYINATEDKYLRGHLKMKYEYPFNNNIFSNNTEFFYDFDNEQKDSLKNITAITFILNKTFSFKTSYEIIKNYYPVPDTLKENDSRMSAALIINI